MGGTGRQRCAGDDIHDEGTLDAQLKQRQKWGIPKGQIWSFPLIYLFLLEVYVSWKLSCIWEAAAFGESVGKVS